MRSKKMLKAFTLIELIVTMLIIGILMAAIMRFFAPVNDVYAESSVLSNQRATEMSIASYLGENVRYASNVAIIKATSADNALNTFMNPSVMGAEPTFLNGKKVTKDDVQMICINYTNTYTLNGRNFYGRLIKKMPGQPNCKEAESDLDPTGSSSSYMALGAAFYGPADYYITIDKTPGGCQFNVTSDYKYTQGGSNSGKSFDRKEASNGNTTVYAAEFENLKKGVTGASQIYYIDPSISGIGADGKPSGNKFSRTDIYSHSNNIYVCFTSEEDDMYTIPVMT